MIVIVLHFEQIGNPMCLLECDNVIAIWNPTTFCECDSVTFEGLLNPMSLCKCESVTISSNLAFNCFL